MGQSDAWGVTQSKDWKLWLSIPIKVQGRLQGTSELSLLSNLHGMFPIYRP